MNKLTETAPERIWLQVSDEESDMDRDFKDRYGQTDIIWCSESGYEAEVAYVRADLLKKADQEWYGKLEAADARIAELEVELAQYRDEKNWTRPFDMDGKLINEHALYLPMLKS